jgi:hypothetical protein
MMLWVVPAAIAACPATPPDVDTLTGRVVMAWRDWAWEAFDARVAELRTSIPCVGAVLTAAQARDVHLALALDGARRKDEPAATDALRGLLAVDPTWTLPEDLGVRGSLLDHAWTAAREASGTATGSLPGRGWFVDGAPARRLPTDRSVVLQHDPPLQTWVVVDGAAPAEVAAARRRHRVVWTVAGATAGLAGVGFATAGVAYALYPETPTHPERIEAINHVGNVAGVALGVAAVGVAGVAGVLRW